MSYLSKKKKKNMSHPKPTRNMSSFQYKVFYFSVDVCFCAKVIQLNNFIHQLFILSFMALMLCVYSEHDGTALGCFYCADNWLHSRMFITG